jgi:hypothetical protein
MGDRCYLQMAIRRKDLEPFGKAIGVSNSHPWWDDLHEEGRARVVMAIVHDANYAWLDSRIAAAEAGIVFTGQHDAGDNYGPCAFAAVNGMHIEMPVDHDGNLVLALDDELDPITSMEDIQAFVDHCKAAEVILHQEEEGAGYADGFTQDRSTALQRTA